MSGLNSIMSGIGNSVMTRLIIIGILVLTLLIPVGIIKGVIEERELRQKAITAEVSSKWGREQTIKLRIPFQLF